MIKKVFVLLMLMAAPVVATAQFKVQSDGKIAIQTTSTAQSPISINGTGNSSYYMHCNNTGGKNGIYLKAQGNSSNNIYGGIFSSSQGNMVVGLKGSAEYSTTSIGVMGEGNMGAKAIGVWGGTNSGAASAGIYGSTYGDLGSGLTSGDHYAGFFNGSVKITGSVVTSTTIQGTFLGESSSESASATRGLSLSSPSVIGGLSGLNVTTYQKERPTLPKDMTTIYDLDGDTVQRDEMPEPDIMDEQFYEKSHYALDADRLEEAFPDLVYVNKDGSKVINYMEMIPLLVQSINELSAEIRVLKGQTPEGTVRKARSTTDIQTSSRSQNKLYQNTPNPFKEQTVIRFSLADDVQDAAICIFDMTGKTIKKLPVLSGMKSVSVGGYELGEGMFLYSLVVNGQEIDTKRMFISK